MKNILSAVLLLSIFFASCSRNGDRQLMTDAKKALDAKKYSEAEQLFRKVMSDYPSSESAPEALYGVGAIQQSNQANLPQAVATFESIAQKYPDSKFAGKGIFMAGYICANQLSNTDRARQLYELYLSKYEQADSAMTAMVRFELKNLGKTPEQLLQELQQKQHGGPDPVYQAQAKD